MVLSLADAHERFVTELGGDNVAFGGEGRDFLTRDIFFDGQPAAFILCPRKKEDVAAAVRIAVEAGLAIFPRGGGMSYTGAYVPSVAQSVLIDMSLIDEIETIDEDNMFVTVQPGVTWKKLYETLRARGLRLPAFGTMSGSTATVGGGLSQGSIFYGSTQFGPTAEHVLGLEVVLPDGRLIKTGQAGMDGAKPFFRWHGPDLTGPFLGDCGALGIKVGMTFRLIPWPSAMETLSFGFDDFESVWQTQNVVARAGLAADCYSFDAALQHQLMERNSLIENMAALRSVATGGGNLFKGLRNAARIVAGGKTFMDDTAYSLHIVTEHRYPEACQAAVAEITQIALGAGGRAIPDSVPRVLRAEPFSSMDATLGPSGERWVPVHGLIALSDGLDAMKRVHDLLAGYSEELIGHKIVFGILSNPVGRNAMIIEVLFYWPDTPHELHREIVTKGKLAMGDRFRPNPAARQLVGRLRSEILETFACLGSGPFGIGKSIPYLAYREQGSADFLRAIKRSVDPNGLMNPGSLGL